MQRDKDPNRVRLPRCLCGYRGACGRAAARLASSLASTSSTPAVGGHGHRGPCAASALVLRPGMPVSPMTGEHAVWYALANRGSVVCTVRGYPPITPFHARGQALPFRYADGGGTYVTSRKAVTAVLAPGASGYIGVATTGHGVPRRTDPAGDQQPSLTAALGPHKTDESGSSVTAVTHLSLINAAITLNRHLDLRAGQAEPALATVGRGAWSRSGR